MLFMWQPESSPHICAGLHPRLQPRTETSPYLLLLAWESSPLLPLLSGPPSQARTPDSRGDLCPPLPTSPPGLPTTWSHVLPQRLRRSCPPPLRAAAPTERRPNLKQWPTPSTAWLRGRTADMTCRGQEVTQEDKKQKFCSNKTSEQWRVWFIITSNG